jgi:hypothetical protein
VSGEHVLQLGSCHVGVYAIEQVEQSMVCLLVVVFAIHLEQAPVDIHDLAAYRIH